MINITDLNELLQLALDGKNSVLVSGNHGIGKSEIITQFADEANLHIEVLYLSQNEVADLVGIPFIDKENGVQVTKWSEPIWLNRLNEASSKQGKRCMVFLEELNRAPIDVRQSALQLVLEKRIHEHYLPSKNGETFIVSSINPSDNYQVDDLDPALLDRFLNLEVTADASAWLEWAKKNKVNEQVIDFISSSPKDLCTYPKDNSKGATPRSWYKLGEMLNNTKNIPDEFLMAICSGTIGKNLAAKFFNFYKNTYQVVSVKILRNMFESHKKDFQESVKAFKKLSSNLEVIRISDLLEDLLQEINEMEEKDYSLLNVFLYSVPSEIGITFLRKLKVANKEDFLNLVKSDTELNNKELFTGYLALSEKKD